MSQHENKGIGEIQSLFLNKDYTMELSPQQKENIKASTDIYRNEVNQINEWINTDRKSVV